MAVAIIEDKFAIRELFSEYCFYMDDADFAGVASLFAPEGLWQSNYEHATGPHDIEVLLTRINPDPHSGPKRRHFIANGLIKVEGDLASARTTYVVLMDRGDGPDPIIVGTYVDELVRVSAGKPEWKLSKRQLVHAIASKDIGLRLEKE